MTDPALLQSIIASGGWCQLHYPKDKSLSESLYARLVFVRSEFLVLEKFNLTSDKLSGYLVVLTNTRQRLKKASLVKQILKIGGKPLPDPKLSVFQNVDSLKALLELLQHLKEPIIINQFDRADLTNILEFDSQKIICRPFISNDPKTSFEVMLKEIASLEMQTPAICTDIKQIGG